MAAVSTLSNGTVVGRFLGDGVDGSDDLVPLTGTVRFFSPIERATVAGSGAATIAVRGVTAELNAQGYLSVGGMAGVTLLATDDVDMDPHGWRWGVEFNLRLRGRSVQFDTFYFDLPGGATADLATVTPLEFPSTGVVVTKGVKGDKGDPGPTAGYVHQQTVALSSWAITHPLARTPNIQVYVGGQYRLAEWTADATSATITFPSPVTGYAVLT